MNPKSPTLAFRLVILMCCIVFFSPVKAQQKKELVYRHSGFGLFHKKYFLNNVKISKRDVGHLLEKENKEAYKVFKSARVTSLIGTLISLPAGVLLIVGGGSYIFNGWNDVTKEPGLLIAGTVGLAGSLTLVIVAEGKFKRAASIYNNANSSISKTSLNFGLTRSGGMGLSLSF